MTPQEVAEPSQLDQNVSSRPLPDQNSIDWRRVVVNDKNRIEYLVGSTIVWVAIWISTGAVVSGHEFDEMIPILGGGTLFFIVLVPAALFRKRT
jgi:hypothetical protein